MRRARRGLARAYALQGDTPKARTAYQDFLTLWKDADSDVPILKSKLRQSTPSCNRGKVPPSNLAVNR
jgi:hypothetical protein